MPSVSECLIIDRCYYKNDIQTIEDNIHYDSKQYKKWSESRENRHISEALLIYPNVYGTNDHHLLEYIASKYWECDLQISIEHFNSFK